MHDRGDRTAREYCWQAARGEYLRRVLVQQGGELGLAMTKMISPYDREYLESTGFEWRLIADVAPLPAGTGIREHQEAFQRLRKLFDEEWWHASSRT